MIPNQHIRDDLFRYEGRFSWFLFFRYFLFTPGFRYSCIWRWTQSACKLTKPFWILLLRHYQVKYAIQIPHQTRIGRGLKIGHWGHIVINPCAKIGHNFNIAQGALIGNAPPSNRNNNQGGAPTIGNNVVHRRQCHRYWEDNHRRQLRGSPRSIRQSGYAAQYHCHWKPCIVSPQGKRKLFSYRLQTDSKMNSPIRVLHVLTIMNRGGAETMVMNYYRHIDRSKVQFDFLLHRQERGAYDDEIESMGGRIFRIPPIFNFFAHQKAVRQFFNEHPEYQIIHGHVGELGYCIYKEATKRGLPTIIAHAHNASCDRNWKWPIRTVLKHLIRSYVNTPMTCGTDAAKWLFGKKLAQKATMLNNAIDAQKYAFNGETRKKVREEMGWNGHWVIGDVARFSPPKNHIGLLSIFKEVLGKEPKALLVLVGEKTGLYVEVKQKAEAIGIAHAVQFLGTRTDIPQLLQGFDVYCSPSLYEGLSVSMVEAQAAGLRVVASDKVPQQVAIIPDFLSFIPLSETKNKWSDALFSYYDRANTFNQITTAGFDIYANVAWLQDFYLSRHHSK